MSNVAPGAILRPVKVMVAGKVPPGPYWAFLPTVPLGPLIEQPAPEKPPLVWQSMNWLEGRLPVNTKAKDVTVTPVSLITS